MKLSPNVKRKLGAHLETIDVSRVIAWLEMASENINIPSLDARIFIGDSEFEINSFILMMKYPDRQRENEQKLSDLRLKPGISLRQGEAIPVTGKLCDIIHAIDSQSFIDGATVDTLPMVRRLTPRNTKLHGPVISSRRPRRDTEEECRGKGV